MKSKFREIKKALQDKDVEKLNGFFLELPRLLEVLGSEDSELRDRIAYSTLSGWLSCPDFPSDQRKKFMDLLLSDAFLFCDIQTNKSNSALKRSFSVLVIGDLIDGDATIGKLDSEYLSLVSQKLRSYVGQEQDRRGLDPSVGWVHCIAHAADAFVSLGRNKNTDTNVIVENIRFLLDFIRAEGERVFLYEEDFRIGIALAESFIRLREKPELVFDILKGFTRDYFYNWVPFRQNLFNTLRCSYLELLWRYPEATLIQKRLKEIINRE